MTGDVSQLVACLPNFPKALGLVLSPACTGVVEHACVIPAPGGVESRSRVPGHLWLQNEFKASLCYVRHYFKIKDSSGYRPQEGSAGDQGSRHRKLGGQRCH